MFEFEFLRVIENYVKTFQGIIFPVVLCDTTFQVYWSNMAAHANQEALTQTESLRKLLSEYDLSHLSETILNKGRKTIAGIIPFNNRRINMTPIFSGDQYVGIILIVTQPEDAPSWEKLSNVSHASSVFANDVRDTIAGIFSSMDSVALKAELLNADWIKPHLSNIAFDSYRVLRLSNNVIKFARYRNHEADLNLTSYNIFGWLRKISNTVEILGADMGVPIHFFISETDEYLTLDSKKFETAFFNVVHNALYYTKKGNQVIITAQAKKEHVLITVEDQGIGIPEEALPRLFEPYFSYAPPGFPPTLGLGLTVAHMVFTSHEGSIQAESILGEGTKISITFPYPKFTDTLHLAQGDEVYSLQDRFSPMYVGLTCAKNSPYREPVA